MEVPELDIQAGLDRLRRWNTRAVSALEAHHETLHATGERDSDLERDIQDFTVAAVREMGDILLRCREQVELTWKAVGADDPVRRACNFEESLMSPHPALRGIMSARHADAHLGGLVVLRLLVRSAEKVGEEVDFWLSPRIPPAVNELLRRKLPEEELMRFNAPTSLPGDLRVSTSHVEAFVGAVYEEVERIKRLDVESDSSGEIPTV